MTMILSDHELDLETNLSYITGSFNPISLAFKNHLSVAKKHRQTMLHVHARVYPGPDVMERCDDATSHPSLV